MIVNDNRKCQSELMSVQKHGIGLGLALARVINYAPRGVSYAPRAMLQIVASPLRSS
jgi:hypothetical protein